MKFFPFYFVMSVLCLPIFASGFLSEEVEKQSLDDILDNKVSKDSTRNI